MHTSYYSLAYRLLFCENYDDEKTLKGTCLFVSRFFWDFFSQADDYMIVNIDQKCKGL